MNRIDQLLDCMALPELPVGELAPERISGITERTLELVHTKTKTRAPRRTLRGVFAAAAAAAVLCTSAFAAQRLGLVDFTAIFGARGAELAEHTKTYEAYPAAQEDTAPAPAAKAGDYHVTPVSAYATKTLLCVTVDCSRTEESVPAFQKSGLRLGISGFDAVQMLSLDAEDPRYVLCAPLDEPFDAGKEVAVCLTAGETQTELLRVPVEAAETSAETKFSSGTLARAVCTQVSLYVEGKCDAGSEPAKTGTLDFAGFSIELYDSVQAQPEWDLQGYLVRCETEADGTFRLEWAFTKQTPFSFRTLHYDGLDYELPELTPEETAVEQTAPRFGTAAQTQDYTFTLESVTADENAACAIVRVEPRTEYGAAHMGQNMPQWSAAFGNRTAGTGSFGSALVEAGEDVCRYLLWCTGNGTPFAEGDVLKAQLLDILEPGDTRAHSYDLFCQTLGPVLQGNAHVEAGVYRVALTPLTFRLEDTRGGSVDGRSFPEVSLSFHDGTVQMLQRNEAFGTPGLVRLHVSGTEEKLIWEGLYTAAIDPAEVLGITIDGVFYAAG